MNHFPKVLVCFLATVCAAAALAQTEDSQLETSSKPTAYVYLSGSSHIYGFAASSSGKLTKITGSPFAGSGYSAAVSKDYLFTVGPDSSDIYGYSIAGNGGLKLASKTDAHKYYPHDCGNGGYVQADLAGKAVYYQVGVSLCGEPNYIQAFKVLEKGELQYDGRTDSGIAVEYGTLALNFATGNKHVYQTSCGNDGTGGVDSLTEVFKRESDGLLSPAGYDNVAPRAKKAGYVYCSELAAADGAGHLAYGFLEYEQGVAGAAGPFVLASYKVSAEGKLSTESTYANMPSTTVSFPYIMSVAPSGKFLAVAGIGFQIFHFNGSSPVTHFSAVVHPRLTVFQTAWDGDDHLYVLGVDKLYVYAVTESSIHEAPGSPYSLDDAETLNVLPLK